MKLSWCSWAATDVGTVRAANEDAHVNRPERLLWAVADGAGGHQHGEVAAGELKAALESPIAVPAADRVQEIRQRVAAVHTALRARADAETVATGAPVTIASTLVVLLAEGPHFACLWCGDSRAYLLRDGAFTQLSRDHSLVQELVDSGMLDADAAERHPHANVLTRAIGAEGPTPDLDKITGRAEPGDRFLLCSDGLFKALEASAIQRLVTGKDPARALIDAALEAGARDNVTAIVVATDPPGPTASVDDIIGAPDPESTVTRHP